ncbi:MAG TPA: hypothetical protein VGD10_03820 [Allosphingosinicella sp.]|uniref:hypothetical protein n=1 Tax=Allosphingosinicella sp. TaxID=2823234 RepID=UPI002ED7BE7C
MTQNIKMMAAASVIALAAAGASPAFAAGTQAGSTITNNVTVAFKVNNIDQTAATASDSFTVDRKVNLTVAEVGTTTTQVTPGQQSAVTTFAVTNSSNAPLDLVLAATQLSGGTAAHGGTDSFNATDVKVYRDVNSNGQFDSGTDVEVSYLDQVAADTTVQIIVVGNIPLSLATGSVAGVRLTATAHEATAAGSQGAAITQTTGANTAGVDTVFADDTTPVGGNVSRNGETFGEDDYTVLAAALTAEKTSLVISDPFNGTTNPKMIPGAVVEYCVAVTNASGGATATNITISDTLPSETVYLGSYGIKVNGTKTGSTCNEDGAAGGSHAAGVVTAPLSDIAAGTTRTVKFRVTVQ